MTPLLTISDFVDDVQISLNSNNAADFDAFLERIQKSFIRNLLGVPYYNAVSTAYDDETATDAQKLLIEGGDVEDEFFNGVKEAFKYYAYFNYLRNSATTHTPVGLVEGKTENATIVYPTTQVIVAQNKCFNLCLEVEAFLDYYPADYSTVVFTFPFTRRFNMFAI